MGYHLTILRTPGQPILENELAGALARMSGLACEQKAGGLSVFRTNEGESAEAMFLEDGELWTSNPSQAFLREMIELAGLLGARVRGDELETYRAVDDTYHHPDDRELIEDAHALSRTMARAQRRTDWIMRMGAITMIALAGWISFDA